MFFKFSATTYLIKIVLFAFNATTIYIFFINKFYLYNCEQGFYSCISLLSGFFSINCIFILEKIKKSIFKTTFILMSANKKIFSKNQTLYDLS